MNFNAVYFLGAGGIGMSALERYFRQQGLFVAGYDRTPSTLTDALQTEGIEIHFEDNPELIPAPCRNPQQTLVVYTPAIPANHQEMAWFRENGFELHKRAQVLGTLTQSMKGLCVAGTHGKTSTSAMTAHLLHQSHVGCNAFLGGITKNYGTNYLLSAESEYVVIEADEFDRSFHHLRPYATAITSADPDHLDIYGTEEAYLESFAHYTSLIQPGGALVVHRGLRFEERLQSGVRRYDYSRTEGDFHALDDVLQEVGREARVRDVEESTFLPLLEELAELADLLLVEGCAGVLYEPDVTEELGTERAIAQDQVLHLVQMRQEHRQDLVLGRSGEAANQLQVVP